MSKKKSFMDVDNIISEGIYSKFIDKIASKIAKSNLKKDKKIKKDLDNLNKELTYHQQFLNEAFFPANSFKKIVIKCQC